MRTSSSQWKPVMTGTTELPYCHEVSDDLVDCIILRTKDSISGSFLLFKQFPFLGVISHLLDLHLHHFVFRC